MSEHKSFQDEVCRSIGCPVNDIDEYIPLGEVILTLAVVIGAMFALQAAARAIADYLILPYWYGIWP